MTQGTYFQCNFCSERVNIVDVVMTHIAPKGWHIHTVVTDHPPTVCPKKEHICPTCIQFLEARSSIDIETLAHQTVEDLSLHEKDYENNVARIRALIVHLTGVST